MMSDSRYLYVGVEECSLGFISGHKIADLNFLRPEARTNTLEHVILIVRAVRV